MNAPEITLAQDDSYDVQPHEIDSVLQRLWRDSLGEEAEASVMQVRTLTLLICVPAARASAELLATIDRVAVEHPGRTITMLIHDDPRPPRAHVAIACRVGNGGKQICGEQITITCGDGGAALPSIAAALQIAGVPVFLLWLGDPPFHTELLDSFVEATDRMIVDSRTWHDPASGIVALQKAVDTYPLIVFTDLRWNALTAWRRQTAQCFDLPQARPYLERLRRLVIRHGQDTSGRASALMLVGWIASRLGWTLASIEDASIVFEHRGASINVTLEPANDGDAVEALVLGADDGAAFTLTYQPASSCIKTHLALPETAPLDRVARLRQPALHELIGEDLNMLDRDHGFEAALALAAQMVATSPNS